MNGLKYVRCETSRNTMDELAKILKVSKQAIYTWESGRKKIPEKRLNQLSDLTGVPKEYLLLSELSDKDKIAIKKYRLEKELKLIEEL